MTSEKIIAAIPGRLGIVGGKGRDERKTFVLGELKKCLSELDSLGLDISGSYVSLAIEIAEQEE